MKENKKTMTEQFEESILEDSVSNQTCETMNERDWTNTADGLYMLDKILKKSQEDHKEGKVYSNEEVEHIISERYKITLED